MEASNNRQVTDVIPNSAASLSLSVLPFFYVKRLCTKANILTLDRPKIDPKLTPNSPQTDFGLTQPQTDFRLTHPWTRCLCTMNMVREYAFEG